MTAWTPIGNAFVFSAHASGSPVPVGQIAIQSKGFAFRYANSWLANPQSFALDPINLPLSEQQLVSPKLWGAFEDSTPDNWGKKVLLATHKQHPQNEIEWLLASRGAGVGCLLFSASRHQLPRLHEAPPFESLERLLLAAEQIDRGDYQPTDEMAKLLEYGSSMGGARPKVTVEFQGGEWIAKLGRRDDIFDQARAEFATLNMAEAAGIEVPERELIELGGRAVLLVKRFDRHGSGRGHYLSAYASINTHRMRVGDNDGPMSYLRIADVLKKISDDALVDLVDLYRRMVFNVVIGNSDDHLRNHGCLMVSQNTYRLSPAFDLISHPSELGLQALIIGRQGRISNLENVLSEPERFAINPGQARQIVVDICQVMEHAGQFFKDAGMNAQDVSVLSQVCRRFNAQVESW